MKRPFFEKVLRAFLLCVLSFEGLTSGVAAAQDVLPPENFSAANFDSSDIGRDAVPSRGGTGWNDGEKPPFPRDDEAEVREAVFFEGVSRDVSLDAFVLSDHSNNTLLLKEYILYEERLQSGDLMFIPSAFLSLYPASDDKEPEANALRRKEWVQSFAVVWGQLAQSRRLDALRLEYLRLREEALLLTEAGLKTMVPAPQAPLYSIDRLYTLDVGYSTPGHANRIPGPLDALNDGYYTREAVKLLDIRVIPITFIKDLDEPERLRRRQAEIRSAIMTYWDIPEGASEEVWEWYIREKERKMKGGEGEGLSHPGHLEFLYSVAQHLMDVGYEEDSYRYWSVAWIRQCQAHRELSGRLLEAIRRSDLEDDYFKNAPGLLGVFISPKKAYQEIFEERRRTNEKRFRFY